MCHYTAKNEAETQLQVLRRENNELHGFIDYLRTRPKDEAKSNLQQLRISNSAQSMLSSFISGSPLRTVQYSSGRSPYSSLTNARWGSSRIPKVNGLIAHSALDLPMESIVTKKTPVGRLLQPVNQLSYSSSSCVSLHGNSPQSASIGAFPTPPTNSFFEQMNEGDNEMDDVFKVSPELDKDSDVIRPRYLGSLFSKLQIKFWTTVPVTENFAAAVIAQYLQTDHLVYGLFDAQLFVRGLTEFQENFCSPFLVSALLALGCVFASLHI